MTNNKKYSVLILCTGNSARSIMVEALFNTIGPDYFQAVSAGSHPTGKVNPFALEQISHLPLNSEPSSKSWNVFSGVPLDFVITVCGNAAQEICPCFGGDPKHIHWGEADPAAVTGADDDKRQAFSECFNLFDTRIKQLIDNLDKQQQIDTNTIMQTMLELADS
ncbi:MAG: arsenate reductase ArsC [Methylophaga sp.]|nr:arsenate reductase ArsC [Methylophaga sp.]